MADNDPLVIQIIQLVVEVLVLIVKVFFEIFKNWYRFFIPQEPKDVSEEIVLITGAGHGIGQAVALRFARLGSKVVCVDINPKGNEETYQMIKSEKGKVFKYECDVTDRAAVFQLAEKIRKEIGDVTILMNNAGIMPCKSVFKQTEQEIRTMMNLNVNAVLWTIQAFVPSMIERNYGHLVSMSSMAGLMGLRNLVPYCGSKYAVKGIMEGLASELHEDPRDTNGIKFTTIYPHIVNTGLCKKPRVRFESLLKVVEVDEAADAIIDAVRREYFEITIPSTFLYLNKYQHRLLPFRAGQLIVDFCNTGVDPHE